MSKASVRVLGEKDVFNFLERLVPSDKQRQEALKAGAKIIQEAAASNAPGSIAQAIVIEEKDGGYLIGPDEDHFYASFIEFGTTGVTIKPKDAKALKFEGIYRAFANPNGTPARPFLRPAYDENKEAVIKAIKEKLYG